MTAKTRAKRSASRATPRSSEFRAYPWISSSLKKRGWNTANPLRNPAGQVYTQQECLAESEIAAALGGKKPENVVCCTSDARWIIEAKKGQEKLSLAVKEAKEYADLLNESSAVLRAPFASGVAGTEEQGFLVETFYKNRAGTWAIVRLGSSPLTRFLSQKEVERILHTDNANLYKSDLTLDEALQLSRAINLTLHRAKVDKEQRVVIVAILLLALNQDISLSLKADAKVFIDDINSRASKIFETAGKQQVWDTIALRPSKEAIQPLASALAVVINDLKEADILYAVRTADVLGAFFESFLRYGNTAKELGIVLTPRHICWLAAEVLAVSKEDLIYDPAAGTGGFLIAAFNRVARFETASVAKKFASERLYGAEDSTRVAALAFVNMYLRGDGKHNLKMDSCFKYRLATSVGKKKKPVFREGVDSKASESAAITKVMMNPPFSLKDDVQKEPDFIDHGLRQLQRNGLLFAILPTSVLYEKQFSAWQARLLAHHTVAAVMTFPTDLFYPVATESLAIIVRKGVPHPSAADVLWARISNDGFVKRKGFRVEEGGVPYTRTLGSLAHSLQAWVQNGVKQGQVPGALEFRPISSSELIPQAHLGLAPLPLDAFACEVRRVYKQITSQLWDADQQQEHSDV